jgi:hypothetical protein
VPKLRIMVKARIENDDGTWSLRVTPQALTTDVGAVIGALTGQPFTITGLSSGQVAPNAPGTVYNCPIQT